MNKLDCDEFEKLVKQAFSFIENEYDFIYSGLKPVQGDPRDSYLAAKYRLDALSLDVVWNEYSKSLGIFIRFNMEDLKRSERFVYFEPFIEFISDGSVEPIVPQIYSKMGVGVIEKVMEQRNTCFEYGIQPVLARLAARFKGHYQQVESATYKTIKDYQSWYQKL